MVQEEAGNYFTLYNILYITELLCTDGTETCLQTPTRTVTYTYNILCLLFIAVERVEANDLIVFTYCKMSIPTENTAD